MGFTDGAVRLAARETRGSGSPTPTNFIRHCHEAAHRKRW